MAASSKTLQIESFVEQLKQWKLADKIKRCAIHDFDQARWQANRLSVRFLEFQYRYQRQQPGEWRYFSGYMAHRQTEVIARLAYLRKVRRQLTLDVGDNILLPRLGKLFDWLNASRLLAACFGVLIALSIWMLFTRLLLQHCHWKRGAEIEKYPGVAVDHIFGIERHPTGEVERTNFHDGLLVEDEVDSSFYRVALLGYGWSLNSQQLDIEHQSDGRFRVFGIRARRVTIDPLIAIRMLLRHWLVAFHLVFSNTRQMTCQKNYYVLAYCKDRFLACLSFVELRPTAYLSRLDYSHRHHAVGAACKESGVHYAGVCHSALGGDAYVPQRSIISFDTFFVYSSWFPQHFFPTWSNPFTRLETMGVWRSDLSVRARQVDVINKTAKLIRQKLQKDWIVALHLPVPQAYMFDKTTVSRWMEGFSRLVGSHPDVAFILFPRRLSQAPGYFQEQVEVLINYENCALAEVLEPSWQQSYRWSSVCDMVVGCFYSDTVAEALASGIPALLYTDTGKGCSEVERFDRSLVAYDVDEIASAMESAQLGAWPDKLLWQRIHEQWLGVADGQCIMRMRSVLAAILKSNQSNV